MKQYLVLLGGDLRYLGQNGEYARNILPEGQGASSDVLASYHLVDNEPVGELYFNAHRAKQNEQLPVQDLGIKGTSFPIPLSQKFPSGSEQDTLATRVLKIINGDLRHASLVDAVHEHR